MKLEWIITKLHLGKYSLNFCILCKCTKNRDHMLYCFWDMVRDRCNCYFSCWAIFCIFRPLAARRMKISKNWKNTWRYHYFRQVHQKSWSYTLLFLRYGTWEMSLLFFILVYFLPFYPANSPKNQNFKKWKNSWRHHFTFVPKVVIRWSTVPEIWCATVG